MRPRGPADKRRRRTAEAPPIPEDDALEAGPPEADEPERGPLRRCIVTRARMPKERMIRFVVLPPDVAAGRKAGLVAGQRAGVIVPDLTATLPGRGIWLSANRDVIETARTRGGFARAARCQVTVSPDLTSELGAALLRRVVETLGLARRAGQAVAGFQKAREWLDGGRAGLVVQASDGSAEERQRFLGPWHDRIEVVAPLDAARLGGVFGRGHAVHVVLARGRLAERVRCESARLAGVLGIAPPESGLAGRVLAGHDLGKDDAAGAAGGLVTDTGG